MRLSPLTLVLALSLLAACGQKEATPAPAPAASAPASVDAPAAAQAELGKGVYNKTCALCHGAGVAGAPRPGDKADWAPRIAQGMPMLYQHAIEGFSGSKGMMPARGGGGMLTDEQVKAAVDFMVSQSR